MDGVNQRKNTIVSTPAKLLPRKGNGEGYIMVRLLATNDSATTNYIKMGVDTGTDNSYKLVTLSNVAADTTVSANSSKEIYVIFNITNFCAVATCSDIDNTTSDTQKDFKIHFLTTTETSPSDPVTGTENGLYITLKFSDRLPENSLNLTQLKKGDERLYAYLSEGEAITQMSSDVYKTYVHRFTTGHIDCATNQAIGDASGSAFSTDEVVKSGIFKVKNLTNGVAYNLGFSLTNKYQFASKISQCLEESPEDIAAFLESQACYLISAGFGKRHYVLDFFREIRDEYFLSFEEGRTFVNWYYRTAPIFAPYIMESPILSFIIRSFAYLFYYTIHFWYLLLSLIFFLAGFLLVKRQRKSLA